LIVGAGLGSSASFSVCLSACLLILFGFIQRSLVEKEDFRTSNMSAHYGAMINKYALLAEKIIHGNPSGLDNTICTYGKLELYSFLSRSRRRNLFSEK
jgi:mevalonate kinase